MYSISPKKSITDFAHRGVDDTYTGFAKGISKSIEELSSLLHQVLDLKSKKANAIIRKRIKELRKIKAAIKKTLSEDFQ